MIETSLQIRQLVKRLSREKSVGEINLTLRRGKKVALLGVNGAGKSSFIRLLVGEELPDIGSIFYQASPSSQASTATQNNLPPQAKAFKKYLGYQADTMLAIENLNAGDYLSLCGQMKHLTADQINHQIDLLNKVWSIEHLLDIKMAELSKGNLQKLAIAQVFLNSPRYLIFDEPCQSLDPLEQEKFGQLLENLSEFELCIFSTHNVKHATELADEILLFHESKIAYHFDLLAQKKHTTRTHLLVCRQPNDLLEKWLDSQSRDLVRISHQVFKFKNLDEDNLSKYKNELSEKSVAFDFFLPEEEALLPLFRMLASSELDAFCHSDTVPLEEEH